MRLPWVILALLGSFTWMAKAVTVVLPPDATNDVGYQLASRAVADALIAKGHAATCTTLKTATDLPGGDVILASHQEMDGASRPEQPEGFRISPVSRPNRRALTVVGDQRGLMYGLFRLAELITISDDPWQIQYTSSPDFPIRIFSEQGQLLDIPDIAYYSDQSPYVNTALLSNDVEKTKQLMRHVAANGFNAFAFLHLNVEEYIDYRYLDQTIYPDDDRHRLRSPVFCRYLTDLCDYAHALHLDIYMQVYEIAFPPRLDELYKVHIDSPNIERIVQARYRELFERVPLDGVIITATEQAPRCGYKARQLWKTKAEAARMATIYHQACRTVGKQCIFRLWRVAYDAEGFAEVARAALNDTVFAIKNTGGDYYLDHPLTTAITSGLPRQHNLTVLFDTFREFDGWSRLFCYMKRWGERVRACRDNGVIGINAWGPWSPGCIWADEDGTFSWQGRWNSFRMFINGFTPGQANTYLIARLAWDADADTVQIAREFAALHLGSANAAAAAEALLATEDAFNEEYVKNAHPCYLKWTMVFAPREDMMKKAYQENSLASILESNRRAIKHVERMLEAFAQVDPGKVPDPKIYADFKTGIDKTALYLRTLYSWRECWWRNRTMRDSPTEQREANQAATQKAKAELMAFIGQWEQYPEEAVAWRITLRPVEKGVISADAFPYGRIGFLRSGENASPTMESTALSFDQQDDAP